MRKTRRQSIGLLHRRPMIRWAAFAVLLAAAPAAAQECLNPALTLVPRGQESGGCRTYDGQPEQCAASYIMGGNGPTSCFLTPDGYCEGCGPNNEGLLCTNTCQAALQCAGDPARTQFGQCRDFDGEPAQCNHAFGRSDSNTAASCFVDHRCVPCGGVFEDEDDTNVDFCINSCVPPPTCADGTRTTFTGGPGTRACRQFDNNEAACNQAFALSFDGVVSCFYDDGVCLGCGPNNEGEICTNTCVAPPPCIDETRTTFAGGPFTAACRQFDGNEAACNLAYALSGDGPVSCFYHEGDCLGCGRNNQGELCTNTCALPPSCADETRTYVGGPDSEGCRQFESDPEGCESAFVVGDNGRSNACFYDGEEGVCRGCGPANEGAGRCANSCVIPVPCADQTRTIYTGPPDSAGCTRFDGDPASCAMAYVEGGSGVASCYYDAENETCRGCGPANEGAGRCANSCVIPAPCADQSRTIYTGPPDSAGCTRFDGDPASCAMAYVEGGSGVASCYYDAENEACRGCGPSNEGSGACTNTCIAPPSCPLDQSRTIYTGGPGSQGCREFDGNPGQCLQAFVRGFGGIASCYYDADSGSCRGCGPNNVNDGACVNTCIAQPFCTANPERTQLGCGRFDGNPAGCDAAYGLLGDGSPTSCVSVQNCRVCDDDDQLNGECTNACVARPSTTAVAPSISWPGLMAVLLAFSAVAFRRLRRRV